jgi:kinesin family protein 1
VVAFSGHLEFPSQPGQNDRWQRKWFAIRRPYMYIYEDCTESDEIGVISLLDIKIQYDLSVLEQATARANLFCVFTKHHGYVFQAESAGSKMQWLSQIDPLRISADQSNSVMS